MTDTNRNAEQKAKQEPEWSIKVDGVLPCPKCGARNSSVSGHKKWKYVIKKCESCQFQVRGTR